MLSWLVGIFRKRTGTPDPPKIPVENVKSPMVNDYFREVDNVVSQLNATEVSTNPMGSQETENDAQNMNEKKEFDEKLAEIRTSTIEPKAPVSDSEKLKTPILTE